METRTYYGFEKQCSKVYTRAVFAKFHKNLKKSTLFRVTESPERIHTIWCSTETRRRSLHGHNTSSEWKLTPKKGYIDVNACYGNILVNIKFLFSCGDTVDNTTIITDK
jgi:hypothetical protein